MMEFKKPSMPMSLAKPVGGGALQQIHAQMGRTSSLMAPIMLLAGHEGEVYTAKFSPDGTCLASAGHDMKIYLWNVYGECDNFSVLSGHLGAVMQLRFAPDSSHLYTCSTDKTVRAWSMETGACVRKLRGHATYVNGVASAAHATDMVASVSDDGAAKLWDVRQRSAAHTFENRYPLLAVSLNQSADQLICAGIDNDVKVWDVRKQCLIYAMPGHGDTITGMDLSPDGNYLITNAMDCTVRMWDVRPFAAQNRQVKMFHGHIHNFEKNLLRCSFSRCGKRVTAGSADRFVYVWDVQTQRVQYKLPGHQGSVNETDIHPFEPICKIYMQIRVMCKKRGNCDGCFW